MKAKTILEGATIGASFYLLFILLGVTAVFPRFVQEEFALKNINLAENENSQQLISASFERMLIDEPINLSNSSRVASVVPVEKSQRVTGETSLIHTSFARGF